MQNAGGMHRARRCSYIRGTLLTGGNGPIDVARRCTTESGHMPILVADLTADVLRAGRGLVAHRQATRATENPRFENPA